MSDFARQLAEKTFTKEYFLSSVRAGCEGMLKMLGEELWEIYQGELMDLVMGIYEKEYPAYLEVQVQVLDEVYTSKEIMELIDIHDEHPWLHEKTADMNRLTMEKNHENSVRIMDIVGSTVDDFLEGKLDDETDTLPSNN